jgi:hypothetical protein
MDNFWHMILVENPAFMSETNALKTWGKEGKSIIKTTKNLGSSNSRSFVSQWSPATNQ